jgi:hypothetical protein
MRRIVKVKRTRYGSPYIGKSVKRAPSTPGAIGEKH